MHFGSPETPDKVESKLKDKFTEITHIKSTANL